MLNVRCMLLLLYGIHACAAFKVLVVFPLPGKSHSILGDGVVKHLLKAGHEVTYITTYPKVLKPHASLREVNISSQHSLLPKELINIEKIMKNEVDVQGLGVLVEMFFRIQVGCFEHEEVRKILKDPKERFDVVIVEWMFLELVSGISAVFNCPYIWLSTVDPHWMVLKLIDEIPNPAYNPDAQSNSELPFTMIERAQELFKMIMGFCLQYFYISGNESREYQRLLGPIIRSRGLQVPDFETVRYNASLMLGNSHVSLGLSTRLPQSYKPIAGYHIDDSVPPLPEHLQKILDNAKHGLIYFSMGSNLRSKELPTALKDSILKMFGKLKQTVLWKFEEDLPNRPSNVHIVQWAPQQSILAHPNCILFITHGGLLSATETIHYGKPIIGIPVFADQFHNVDRAVKRGFAKRVDLSYHMTEPLRQAIEDVIGNPSYLARAKQLSMIYHDRPVSPGKELVHWVEHVVRTAGAPHLRSAALFVPWYQKCFLDLAAIIIILLSAIIIAIKKIIRSLSNKQQKKKTQ